MRNDDNHGSNELRRVTGGKPRMNTYEREYGFLDLRKIRQRRRATFQSMTFGWSVASTVLFLFTAFNRTPIWFGSWAVVLAFVAYLSRPRWMRGITRVNVAGSKNGAT